MAEVTIEDLPSNVLSKIFNYLSVSNLVCIQNVNRKFRDVVHSLNISQETKTHLKLFCVQYRKNREHLDVNNFSEWYVYINEYEYREVFRNLYSLRIKSEHIEFHPLCSVLSKFSNLQELRLQLTSFCPYESNFYEDLSYKFSRLKKLFISFPRNCIHLRFLHVFLAVISKYLEYIHIHQIIYQSDSDFYASTEPSVHKTKIRLQKLKYFIMTQENISIKTSQISPVLCKYNNNRPFLEYLFEPWTNVKSFSNMWIAPEIQHELVTEMIEKQNILNTGTRKTSFLQKNVRRDECATYSMFENALGSLYLSFSCTDFNEVNRRYLHAFSSSRVKYLYLNRITTSKYNSTDGGLLCLHRFFPHLSELNMVHTHIGLCFHVCKEISNLTELKSVALSACLATNICCERERNQEKTSPLWIVAKKCCKLNKLEIYGCQRCKSHSTSSNVFEHRWDEYLSAMPEIRNLSSLSLINLPSVTNFGFLVEVGKRCSIKRLRIHNVGSKSEHRLFMECLCTFLQNAVSLTYLRISQSNLDFSYSPLWKAMANAKILRQIRFLSAKKCILDIVEVAETLSKLLYLSDLHIHIRIQRKRIKQIRERVLKNWKGTGLFPQIITGGIFWCDENIYLIPKAVPLNECSECFLSTNVAQPKI
ncbi:uncharacterized protein LOC111638527 [Centruroides sculpturatus]|uniref:uncharacterized protein LOC111638527 n=1 Tax=Centruroides sculpturatus TaxID=218467 RepID=UPI000C6E327C|nr:uncharacterized protein LOC111638527 [Centruroides sculpturatus]